MRGKVAKQIRRVCESATTGLPYVAYAPYTRGQPITLASNCTRNLINKIKASRRKYFHRDTGWLRKHYRPQVS